MMSNPARFTGVLFTVCLGVAAQSAPAQSEPSLPYELGVKFVTEHKVKSVVGPSVQVDEQGQVSLAWMEEDKDVRSVLFARSAALGGPMGSPVRVNRPEEVLEVGGRSLEVPL